MLRRVGYLLLLTLLCPLAAGCTIYRGVQTLLLEPSHYWHTADKGVSHHRAKKLAGDAWQAVRAGNECGNASHHYADGFRDGFIDFYLHGGDGTPPPLPPRKYWDIHDRDGGQQAVADWFAGYTHGASFASYEVGHPTVPSAEIVGALSNSAHAHEHARATDQEPMLSPEPQPAPATIVPDPAPELAPGVDL